MNYLKQCVDKGVGIITADEKTHTLASANLNGIR